MCDKTCIFFFFPIINKYFLMAKRSLLSRCPSYIECKDRSLVELHCIIHSVYLGCDGITFCLKRLGYSVVGSILDVVIRIFHLHDPSSHTVALGSTQPLTEMIFPTGKGGRCVGLTTLPLLCADCLEIRDPQPPGTLWACPGL